jgi:hypothetical protein
MSADELEDLRKDVLDEDRPESKDAAEEFLEELRRRGILDED